MKEALGDSMLISEGSLTSPMAGGAGAQGLPPAAETQSLDSSTLLSKTLALVNCEKGQQRK